MAAYRRLGRSPMRVSGLIIRVYLIAGTCVVVGIMLLVAMLVILMGSGA
jgi:hypothetical protein